MTDRFMLPYCLIPLHPHALADTPGGVSRFYRKSVPFSESSKNPQLCNPRPGNNHDFPIAI